MNVEKIKKGIAKVNEILNERKALKAEQSEYSNAYYCNNDKNALEKACEIINKLGRMEGGLYKRMKNLIKEYYDDDCNWLDSKCTDYGKDYDLKGLRMYREFKHTFKFYNVTIAEY